MAQCDIDGRPIHAALKVSPIYDVAVSEHANEKGKNFTDNRRPKLIGLSIEGVNSDLGGMADGGLFTPTAGFDDAAGMHKFFSDLQANPRPVSVSTPQFGNFLAMNLQSYKPVAESKYKRALHYNVTFLEDRQVDLTTTTVTTAQRAQQKKGTAAPEPTPPPKRTGLKAITDTGGATTVGSGLPTRTPVTNPTAGVAK